MAFLDAYQDGLTDIVLLMPYEKVKILRLIENITMGTGAVGYLTESIHGAGSPQAQKIMIQRYGNLDFKKDLAKKIAGIV